MVNLVLCVYGCVQYTAYNQVYRHIWKPEQDMELGWGPSSTVLSFTALKQSLFNGLEVHCFSPL